MKRIYLVAATLLALPMAASAQSLTAAGIADNFTLDTFFTGNLGNGGSYGILNAVAASDGSIIATGYGNQTLLRFNEGSGNTVNGLTAGSATTTVNLGFTPTGIATSGGTTYFTGLSTGIFQVTNNATLANTQVVGTGTINPQYGLWAGPGGTLIAGTSSGAYLIDPAASFAITAIGTPGFVDGVSVSPDGTKAYVEYGGDILAYNIASPTPGTPTATYSFGHAPDGTGVISGGALDGDLIISNNDGTIALLDPSSNAYTIIATGMSRGDLVSPDSNNGTLLVSDIGQVLRLGITGGTIGATDTPEPASMTLLGGALLGLGALRRKFHKQA